MKLKLSKVVTMHEWPQQVVPLLNKVFNEMLECGCNRVTIENFFSNLLYSPNYFCREQDTSVDNLAKSLIKYRGV